MDLHAMVASSVIHMLEIKLFLQVINISVYQMARRNPIVTAVL